MILALTNTGINRWFMLMMDPVYSQINFKYPPFTKNHTSIGERCAVLLVQAGDANSRDVGAVFDPGDMTIS